MDDVKRFDLVMSPGTWDDGPYNYMEEGSEGEYVLYDDYAALEARLTKAVELAEKYVEQLERDFNSSGDDGGFYADWQNAQAELSMIKLRKADDA